MRYNHMKKKTCTKSMHFIGILATQK